jgi:glycosyltransferase involved in cell wall biosynthesis
MRTLSVVMPVYNEADILPYSLSAICNSVDEFVIVDGGVRGPSTDNTREVAEKICGDRLKYITGVFSESNLWDRRGQVHAGLDVVTSDMVMLLSADMLITSSERLRDVIDRNTPSAVYCSYVEFWLSVNYVRTPKLHNPGRRDLGLTTFLLVQESAAYDFDSAIMLGADIITLSLEVVNHHLGWIRPFERQVQKHKRHVQEGHWGELGKRLLNSEPEVLDAWAIEHVLMYPNAPYVRYAAGDASIPIALSEMSYADGSEEVIGAFEKEYGLPYETVLAAFEGTVEGRFGLSK